jgi:hypothetical protein
MLELVIGLQSALILGLVIVLVSQNARLMRAAMSRTPGEFRAAEKAATKPVSPQNKNLVDLDEATQLVLEAVSPMPHGLGGN